MASFDEVDRCSEEVWSVALDGGFGDGVEHHIVKLKIEEIDTTCTGSSIDRHVLKETFEIDTVRGGSGIKQHIVKGELKEVDTTVSLTSGHHHHHHRHHLGHHGNGVDTGGKHHHHHYGHGVNTGGHHHHHHAHHGHDVVVRETRVEEDFNTHTGEFLKRKETFFARDD